MADARENNDLHSSLAAYFVTDDRGLQETATNMDAFVRLKDLLERLDEPILPYETDDAAAERSRQQQVGT